MQNEGQQLSDRLPCVVAAAACPPADVLKFLSSVQTLQLLNRERYIVMSAVLLELWPQ